MDHAAHIARHFGIPGFFVAIFLVGYPTGCENADVGEGKHCHSPAHVSITVARNDLGNETVKWAGAETNTSLDDVRTLTGPVMWVLAVAAFVGMAVWKGNPFEWPSSG